MALKLEKQNIYLSNIERKQTKKGNEQPQWFITARGAFNSSYNKNYKDKNAEPDWVKDETFFVDVVSFDLDTNKLIGSLTENGKTGGSVLASGKIVTRESTGKDGKKYYNTMFIVYNAEPIPVKKQAPATEVVEEIANAVPATDECPF